MQLLSVAQLTRYPEDSGHGHGAKLYHSQGRIEKAPRHREALGSKTLHHFTPVPLKRKAPRAY